MANGREMVVAEDAGVAARETFGGTEIVRSSETAMTAMAALAEATIRAKYVMAERHPRNLEQIRVTVLRFCEDPTFAEEAIYVKPMASTDNVSIVDAGGQRRGWDQMTKRERLLASPERWPRGFSIRAIEAFLQEMGNFDCLSQVVWEDAERRHTEVTVCDLQKNSTYRKTVITQKTIERSSVQRGQEVVAVRTNASNRNVYLVASTADQVNLAESSAISKALRTQGERLLPAHFKAQWWTRCEKTIADNAAKNPDAEKNRLVDAFAAIGIMPTMLEEYLEHALGTLVPAELVLLRKIYVGLTNGEGTWKDVMEEKFGPEETGEGKTDKLSDGAAKFRERLTKVKEEMKPETKAEPKPEPKAEPKPEVKTEPKATETAKPAAEAPRQSEPAQEEDPLVKRARLAEEQNEANRRKAEEASKPKEEKKEPAKGRAPGGFNF